jgi:hypothetical protein
VQLERGLQNARRGPHLPVRALSPLRSGQQRAVAPRSGHTQAIVHREVSKFSCPELAAQIDSPSGALTACLW